MQRSNVVGCGLALKETRGRRTDQPCVVVLVERKLPKAALAAKDVVPGTLGRVPTDVVQVGCIRLLQARTAAARPARPGVSIGHSRVSAGTLGAIVYDRRTGEPLVLSNNHVLANGTTGQDDRAHLGDPIYQPGPADGGQEYPRLGVLWRYVPLDLSASGENSVDAALCRPDGPAMVEVSILGIGLVTGIARVELDSSVMKSGRSTGVTTGKVRAMDATLQVYLDGGRRGRFTDQIVCTRMGESGDSGSLGVTANRKAFGLLFAGSSNTTVFNRMEHVLRQLSVDLISRR
jgi:hypothetical protein